VEKEAKAEENSEVKGGKICPQYRDLHKPIIPKHAAKDNILLPPIPSTRSSIHHSCMNPRYHLSSSTLIINSHPNLPANAKPRSNS